MYVAVLFVADAPTIESLATIDGGNGTILGLYINNEAGLVELFHVEK